MPSHPHHQEALSGAITVNPSILSLPSTSPLDYIPLDMVLKGSSESLQRRQERAQELIQNLSHLSEEDRRVRRLESSAMRLLLQYPEPQSTARKRPTPKSIEDFGSRSSKTPVKSADPYSVDRSGSGSGSPGLAQGSSNGANIVEEVQSSVADEASPDGPADSSIPEEFIASDGDTVDSPGQEDKQPNGSNPFKYSNGNGSVPESVPNEGSAADIASAVSKSSAIEKRGNTGNQGGLLGDDGGISTSSNSEMKEMEARLELLREDLKQRRATAAKLRREYRNRNRERLAATHSSIQRQIKAYDTYIKEVENQIQGLQESPRRASTPPRMLESPRSPRALSARSSHRQITAPESTNNLIATTQSPKGAIADRRDVATPRRSSVADVPPLNLEGDEKALPDSTMPPSRITPWISSSSASVETVDEVSDFRDEAITPTPRASASATPRAEPQLPSDRSSNGVAQLQPSAADVVEESGNQTSALDEIRHGSPDIDLGEVRGDDQSREIDLGGGLKLSIDLKQNGSDDRSPEVDLGLDSDRSAEIDLGGQKLSINSKHKDKDDRSPEVDLGLDSDRSPEIDLGGGRKSSIDLKQNDSDDRSAADHVLDHNENRSRSIDLEERAKSPSSRNKLRSSNQSPELDFGSPELDLVLGQSPRLSSGGQSKQVAELPDSDPLSGLDTEKNSANAEDQKSTNDKFWSQNFGLGKDENQTVDLETDFDRRSSGAGSPLEDLDIIDDPSLKIDQSQLDDFGHRSLHVDLDQSDNQSAAIDLDRNKSPEVNLGQRNESENQSPERRITDEQLSAKIDSAGDNQSDLSSASLPSERLDTPKNIATTNEEKNAQGCDSDSGCGPRERDLGPKFGSDSTRMEPIVPGKVDFNLYHADSDASKFIAQNKSQIAHENIFDGLLSGVLDDCLNIWRKRKADSMLELPAPADNSPKRAEIMAESDFSSNFSEGRLKIDLSAGDRDFGEKIPDFMKKSPHFDEKSTYFGEQSPDSTEKSPNSSEQASNFGEKSPQAENLTHFGEKSPDFGDTSTDFGEESPVPAKSTSSKVSNKFAEESEFDANISTKTNKFKLNLDDLSSHEVSSKDDILDDKSDLKIAEKDVDKTPSLSKGYSMDMIAMEEGIVEQLMTQYLGDAVDAVLASRSRRHSSPFSSPKDRFQAHYPSPPTSPKAAKPESLDGNLTRQETDDFEEDEDSWMDDDLVLEPTTTSDGVIIDGSQPSSPRRRKSAFADLPPLTTEVYSAIPIDPAELALILDNAVDCLLEGRRSGRRFCDVVIPTALLALGNVDSLLLSLDKRSNRAYKQFLFQLTAEILENLLESGLAGSPHEQLPPWAAPPRLKPIARFGSQAQPFHFKEKYSDAELKQAVKEQVLHLLAMAGNGYYVVNFENLSAQQVRIWSRRQGSSDRVERILVEELYQEETHWTVYDQEAVSVKIRMAKQIADLILKEALDVMIKAQPKN